MSSPDFGRYLQSVEERDIDLLLMEEFHAVPEFATWFAERVGLGKAAIFDGAWHSLSDQDGETDLLLRVKVAAERVAILIENKVAAPEQDEQDVRYHLRGVRSQEAGRYDRFVTAICAPQVYLDGLSEVSAYQHRLPYEAILGWYDKQDGLRASWRRAILNEAIQQGRRGYTMKVDAAKTAFHLDYWNHMRTHHPDFVMSKPKPKGPKSTWMYFKAVGFPRGVTLIHKNEQQCIDLQFDRTLATDLARRRRVDWPDGVKVLPRGETKASLTLSVPACDMTRPVAEQMAAVDVVFAAARRLAPFADAIAGDDA